MEFTITRDELLQGLYLTQGVVERRTTIPILANVLIESAGDGISIAATDQEVGVRRRCEAKVKRKGALTTGARKLYEIVRECPEGALVMRSLDNNWIEISAGKSRFKIVGLDPKEFPAMPSASAASTGSVTISANVLREMLERTAFAVSLDETRLNLSGIYVELVEGGTLRMVATDGHRLSMITRPVEASSGGGGVIVPRKGVAEISKVLESGEEASVVQIQGGLAYVARGAVELSMRLVDGEFPDFKQVVPQKAERRLVSDAEALHGALRRVSIVSSERTRGIKLDIEPGRLEISSINPDLGEASEELGVEYDGESFSIGFNAKYLTDVLSVMSGARSVEISFNDEVSPGVVHFDGDADFLYVVMPMRL